MQGRETCMVAIAELRSSAEMMAERAKGVDGSLEYAEETAMVARLQGYGLVGRAWGLAVDTKEEERSPGCMAGRRSARACKKAPRGGGRYRGFIGGISGVYGGWRGRERSGLLV